MSAIVSLGQDRNIPVISSGCRSNANDSCVEVELPQTLVLVPLDPLERRCFSSGDLELILACGILLDFLDLRSHIDGMSACV